jgi:hypothetical protein
VRGVVAVLEGARGKGRNVEGVVVVVEGGTSPFLFSSGSGSNISTLSARRLDLLAAGGGVIRTPGILNASS